jgi:hypothetical protein
MMAKRNGRAEHEARISFLYVALARSLRMFRVVITQLITAVNQEENISIRRQWQCKPIITIHKRHCMYKDYESLMIVITHETRRDCDRPKATHDASGKLR